MNVRRGLTTPLIAAASGAAMLLATTAGAAARSETELSATHAHAFADLAAWSALRTLVQEVRDAGTVEVQSEGARLVLREGDATESYFVASGRLYRETAGGNRSVVQNGVDTVTFERDGSFLVLQVSSREAAGSQTFVSTRGTEIRLRP